MILLKLVLLAFSLLGYCLFFRRKIGIPMEFTPFFTVTSLMVCLYALGFVGSLQYNAWGAPIGFNPRTVPEVPILYYGVRWLFILGWGYGLLWLRSALRDGDEVRAELLNPGLILFFAGFFLIFFPLQPLLMCHTDDIHHWGLAVKCLSIYHGLPGVDSELFYAEYPPGVPLFHYFISTFTNFREGTLLFSHNLMLLAGVVVLTYRISWKYFYVLLLIPFFAFVLQNLFMHGPKYLMVDTTLAVFLAAALHMYFAAALTGEPFFRRAIFIIPAAAALVLTKQVGLIFALVLCAVVSVDGLVVLTCRFFQHRRSRTTDEEKESGPRNRHAIPVSIVTLLVLLVSPWVISESWNLRCEHCAFPGKDLSRPGMVRNVARTFHQIASKVPPAQWPRIPFDRSVRERWFEAFEHSLPENRRTVAERFYTALFQQELNGFDSLTSRENRSLSTFFFTIVIFTLTGLLLFSPVLRGFRIRYAMESLVLLIGAAGYLIFLLFVYLFAFDDGSASRLASFQRYVGSYFHAWFLALFGMASFCFARSEPKWIPRRLAILLAFYLVLYLFFIGMILLFSFEEAVHWGLWGFLSYVAVYFRFVFMFMAVGLILCLRKTETDRHPIGGACARFVWIFLLVFILVKSEFAFRLEQTPYATAVPFRQEVRTNLSQIKSKMGGVRALRMIFETDDPVGEMLMLIADSYRYEIYSDRSITVETFGIDFHQWMHHQYLAMENSDRASPLPEPEEWSKSLKEANVDVLFLHQTSDRFWKRYGELFENGADARNDDCRFYRVEVVPDRSRVVLKRL